VPAVRITVGVLTYRRPQRLAALLPLLVRQTGELRAEGHHADVLVVDNDPSGSAAPAVTGQPADVVRYVVEPEPGIAAARNRVLDETLDADLLVFIDDDERPHEGWLSSLLATWLATGAAAVAGPVVSEFDGDLDPWVAAGDFFTRRRPATGTQIEEAATNNLLLDLHAVRAAALRFDPRFGISGGEDSLFTRRLAATGRMLVWCADAVVSDLVPAERMTRGWVLRRAFSSGNSVPRVRLALARTPGARRAVRWAATASGSVRLAGGGARWLAGTVTGSVALRARGLRSAARGAGMVAGAIGHVYQEYRRPVS
jgi:glycosyltransferase involved in cell wall biosynthesis